MTMRREYSIVSTMYHYFFSWICFTASNNNVVVTGEIHGLRRRGRYCMVSNV